MIYTVVAEKANKDCKEIPTNHLIALCEIGENYKSFCDDLEKLIQSKSNKDLVEKAYRMLSGKSFWISKKYKNFIAKYKHTIEIMKKYSCLYDLTAYSYDTRGKRKTNLDDYYFYQYIQKHKKDMETIKSVAIKIKNLGFDKILFREKLDFSEFEYELNPSYIEYISQCSFLENMEVNPTYLENPIKYKTNSSCYCITLNLISLGDNKEINKYASSIELNNLVFDPNRLPNEITTESTIGFICKLAEKKKEEYKKIQQSVDFNISVSDLKDSYEHLIAVTKKIDKLKNDKDLALLLQQIYIRLIELQLVVKNFESQIIDSHADITNEAIEKEKKLYLDRRRSPSIDDDESY